MSKKVRAMTETTEEWSRKTNHHKNLTSNLKTNIKVFFPNADEETCKKLLRMNLIMIRQFVMEIAK